MKNFLKAVSILLCCVLLAGCVSAENTSDATSQPSEATTDPLDALKHTGYTLYEYSGETSTAQVTSRTIPTEAAVEPTAESFTVSNYFGNNMIIQRDNEIVIWGTADESQNGKIVSAYFKSLSGSATIENGEWKISLNGTLPASTELGNSLVVKGNGVEESFDDVLVGDIWLINGQSNAELTFFGTTSQSQTDLAKLYKEDLANASADDPIRIFTQNPYYFLTKPSEAVITETPQTDTAKSFKWTTSEKKRLKTGSLLTCCSILGYFFAKELVTVNPDVPIGILNVAWGGACLSNLCSAETDSKLPAAFQNKACSAYTVSCGKNGVYNAFISPLLNVPIAGMVFYQGEVDGGYASEYPEALKTYIECLREEFKSDFEVVNMQLTSYGKESAGAALTVAPWTLINELRYAQSLPSITGSISKYLCITTIDHGFQDGDGDGAHPYYKKEIAQRAADAAASVMYGSSSLENTGCPVPKLVEYNDNSVYITYQYAGGGLSTNDGEAPKGFEVKIDGKWVSCDAVIESESVIYIGGLAGKPEGVRYASSLYYTDMTEATLQSGTGIPANAFCTLFD